MESYLIKNDFTKTIQEGNLDQIITSNQTTLDTAQVSALAEARSFLKNKYDVDAEFTNTTKWSFATTYKAGNRVYLDADAYSATATYLLNALVLQAGSVYICTTAITVGEAFNASKWALLGKQYDLFYVTGPYATFNYLSIYAVGDNIFYKDKTYTALKATTILSHDGALQIGVIVNSPVSNIFPNDTKDGAAYWGTGTAYTVAAGTLPTDTTKWTAGDNRDQKILMCVIDIALYHLHSRIAPRNIPEIRISRYIGLAEDRITTQNKIIYPVYSALGWFQSISTGEDVTAQAAVLQPTQGNRIRHGGNVKNINSY